MKVGDYVRTNRGIIAKIIKVNSTGSITCDRGVYYGFNVVNNKRILKDFSSIVESSPSIIDLIEVGDYVNGSKLLSIDYAEDRWGNCDKLHFYYSFEDDEKDVNEYYEELKIKSIVTKEQFESMEYKIGE